MTRYAFEATCVSATEGSILEMVGRARQVTWATFTRHVPPRELRSLFPGPPALEQDHYVTFYKSRFKGRRCFFLVHSTIEYVWTEAREPAA